MPKGGAGHQQVFYPETIKTTTLPMSDSSCHDNRYLIIDCHELILLDWTSIYASFYANKYSTQSYVLHGLLILSNKAHYPTTTVHTKLLIDLIKVYEVIQIMILCIDMK